MKFFSKLQTLPERLRMQRPKMQEILDALDDDAVALTLIVFSLPAIVPTPGVPAGLLFGSLLIFIGLQMSFGIHPIRIPPGLSGLQIDRTTLKRIIDRAVPHLEKSQRWIRPRLDGFVTPGSTRGIGLVICMMGLLIALPIPFGNTLPGLAVLLLAIGLGQKDGVAVLAGLGLAVISGAASWGLLAGSWWLIKKYLLFA
jgi:hypothetical protein